MRCQGRYHVVVQLGRPRVGHFSAAHLVMILQFTRGRYFGCPTRWDCGSSTAYVAANGNEKAAAYWIVPLGGGRRLMCLVGLPCCNARGLETGCVSRAQTKTKIRPTNSAGRCYLRMWKGLNLLESIRLVRLSSLGCARFIHTNALRLQWYGWARYLGTDGQGLPQYFISVQCYHINLHRRHEGEF